MWVLVWGSLGLVGLVCYRALRGLVKGMPFSGVLVLLAGLGLICEIFLLLT